MPTRPAAMRAAAHARPLTQLDAAPGSPASGAQSLSSEEASSNLDANKWIKVGAAAKYTGGVAAYGYPGRVGVVSTILASVASRAKVRWKDDGTESRYIKAADLSPASASEVAMAMLQAEMAGVLAGDGSPPSTPPRRKSAGASPGTPPEIQRASPGTPTATGARPAGSGGSPPRSDATVGLSLRSDSQLVGGGVSAVSRTTTLICATSPRFL